MESNLSRPPSPAPVALPPSAFERGDERVARILRCSVRHAAYLRQTLAETAQTIAFAHRDAPHLLDPFLRALHSVGVDLPELDHSRDLEAASQTADLEEDGAQLRWHLDHTPEALSQWIRKRKQELALAEQELRAMERRLAGLTQERAS